MKRSLIGVCIVASACHSLDIVPPDPGPPPIVQVIVYTFPNLVQVGDTLRISAEGFNSVGYGFVKDAPFTWSSPDSPTVIGLEGVVRRYAFISEILVRGRSLGKATVRAVANSVTGTGTVEVIPRLSRIQFSPDSVTLAVGDTARFTLTVITATGDTLKGYQPIMRTIPEFQSSVVFVGQTSVRGAAPGTTDITATLAGVVGKGRVIVTAAPKP